MNIQKREVKVQETHLPLPKEKMPECWNDDMRMNYLFSEFRPHAVNPLDWESKMKFWTTLIATWCVHHNQPTFTLSSLTRTFQHNNRTPMCLPTVIEAMHRNRDLILQKEFVHIPPQQTWTAWTIDLMIKRPVIWTFNKVKDSVLQSKVEDEDTTYVHVGACKDLGEKLIASIDHNQIHQILELHEVATVSGYKDLDQLLVVLHALRRKGKAAVKEDNVVLIKFGDLHFSELDMGVYSLRHNEETLTKHLEQLEAEKEAAVQEARLYVSKNMKQAARSCLRKKQILDKCITKRISALDNIRLLLSHLHDAKSDAKVLEAYKMGVTALKTTLKGSGLTEDSATDTMVQVEEALDIHREIQSALAQPIEGEEDLESELAELLSESAPQKTLQQKLKGLSLLTDLPEPPDTLPAKRSSSQKLQTMEQAM